MNGSYVGAAENGSAFYRDVPPGRYHIMTPTVARIGPLCTQTGILSKVSPRSSDPC
jgi:hypothetical protein